MDAAISSVAPIISQSKMKCLACNNINSTKSFIRLWIRDVMYCDSLMNLGGCKKFIWIYHKLNKIKMEPRKAKGNCLENKQTCYCCDNRSALKRLSCCCSQRTSLELPNELEANTHKVNCYGLVFEYLWVSQNQDNDQFACSIKLIDESTKNKIFITMLENSGEGLPVSLIVGSNLRVTKCVEEHGPLALKCNSESSWEVFDCYSHKLIASRKTCLQHGNFNLKTPKPVICITRPRGCAYMSKLGMGKNIKAFLWGALFFTIFAIAFLFTPYCRENKLIGSC